MEAEFQQNRKSYPDLYIITPYDQGKSVFTKSQPSKHVLRRIRLLASETYKFLDDVILKWDDFSIEVCAIYTSVPLNQECNIYYTYFRIFSYQI